MTKYSRMTEEQKKADHERSKRWRQNNKKTRVYKPRTEEQLKVIKERQQSEEVKKRKRETYALRKAGISSPRYGEKVPQAVIDAAIEALHHKRPVNKIVVEKKVVVVVDMAPEPKVVVEKKPKPLSARKLLELRCMEVEALWDAGLCPCGCKPLGIVEDMAS